MVNKKINGMALAHAVSPKWKMCKLATEQPKNKIKVFVRADAWARAAAAR